MIGFFPDLRPEELVYSALARYNRRVGFSGDRRTAMDLFGDENVVPVVDLPGKLDAVLARLPRGHRYTIMGLVANHTLAPLYTAFANENQCTALLEAIGTSSVAARARAGLAASLLPPLKRLRYCPKCFTRQLHSGEEPFWDRLHQVPWVEACPDHQLYLENAFDRGGGRLNRFRYFDASELTGHFLFRKCDDPAALALARSTRELLVRGLRRMSGDNVRIGYRNLWRDVGLRSDKHGFIDDLWRLVASRFEGVLLRLDISSSDPPPWFLKFLRHPERSRASWQHLLILEALGKKILDLDTEEDMRSRFNPSERCPNPVCPAKRLPKLEKPAHRKARPEKLMCAECGYTFVVGPKKRVVDHGPIWKQHLAALWLLPLSTRQIAEKLGCDSLTVVRHAHGLELKFPRIVDGRETTLRQPHRPVTYRVSSKELQTRRQKWTSVARKATGRKSARISGASDYAWLRRNDLSWLTQNLPQKKASHSPSIQHELWEERENKLLERLDAATGNIVKRGTKPTQLAIARELSATNVIPAKLKRMPKLSAAITLACTEMGLNDTPATFQAEV